MNVILINNAGIKKECPTGFSWTTLFFGFLVPLARGDLIGVIIQLLASVFSIGIFWFIWPFMYNKNYINRLLEKGYMPYYEEDVTILKGIGINISHTYESDQKSKHEVEKIQKYIPMTVPTEQKPVEPEVFNEVGGDLDFSDLLSLSWPVVPETGRLIKSSLTNGVEKISCSFRFQNVQSREILYTQWELKCFDILKKPILTEIPVSIRHEYTCKAKGIVTVKSLESLPSGTKSFIPYLKAVLYGDQTIEEFPEDEKLISLKPKSKIADIDGFSKAAISYYQQKKNFTKRPQFLYEKNEEGVWTCAFCGTRNKKAAIECSLCCTELAQQEFCTKEIIEESIVAYSAYCEQLEEYQRKRLEEKERERLEEERKRLEEERKRLEEEEKKAQEEREREEFEWEKNKKQWKKIALIALILIVVAGIGFTLWTFVIKQPYVYNKANILVESGEYYKGYELYASLGEYKDSSDQSVESYIQFLELDASSSFLIDGYQWLLDRGYPQEKVFESFAKVLAITDVEEDQIAGLRWLDSKGYVEAKERIYGIANEMVEDGRFYEGYELYTSLGEYKDSQEIVRKLANRQVTLDQQGGTGGSISVPATYGKAMPSATAPMRTGYIFAGYYDQTNGLGTEYYTSGMASEYNWDKVVDATLYARWIPLVVGGPGPARGYIFYDKGSYSDGWRYLEAAPADYEIAKVWGGHGTTVGGTGTAIGTGESNTSKIVAGFGNAEPGKKKTDYAAKVCADLVVTKNGVVYDDWFLPSKDELNLMYKNLFKKNIGGFSDGNYWSSSEYNEYNAWSQYFYSGYQSDINRNYYASRVRPVRAF